MNFFKKNQKFFALCGMIGPFCYVLIWILGGILTPGYNHITDDVSTLLAVGAPNKLLFDSLDFAYAFLMILFFSSLHWAINNGEGSMLGPVSLLVSFIFTLISVFFPLDVGGGLTSQTAQIHGMLVGLMVLFSIVGMLALWRRFKKAFKPHGRGVWRS